MQLYLLGPPRIEQAGHAVDFDTRKAPALLAYLALTGQPQPREGLGIASLPLGGRVVAALRLTPAPAGGIAFDEIRAPTGRAPSSVGWKAALAVGGGTAVAGAAYYWIRGRHREAR